MIAAFGFQLTGLVAILVIHYVNGEPGIDFINTDHLFVDIKRIFPETVLNGKTRSVGLCALFNAILLSLIVIQQSLSEIE